MLAISIVNLILSIFGITVSSIFIVFWCGRYFCARFFARRMPGSHGRFFLGTAYNRGVAEHNSVGVSPLVIQCFPIITFHQDTSLPRHDAMCSVCLGEYKEEECLRMLPQCGHNFHVNCIDAWLQRHATCPVCRMSLQGSLAGGTLMPPPQPNVALQPMPSVADELVAGAVSRPLSEPSDAPSLSLLPSMPTCLHNDAALHHDNHVVLNICSSPSSNWQGPCGGLQGQTARVDECVIDGFAPFVERG